MLLKYELLCTYTSLSCVRGLITLSSQVVQSPDLILLPWSVSHYVWPSSLSGRVCTSAEVVGTGRGEGLAIGWVGTQEDRLQGEWTGAWVKIFEEL